MAEADQLPDKYIVLLEDVVKSNKELLEENKAMRLEIEAKADENRQALKDLNAKLDQPQIRTPPPRGQSCSVNRRSRAASRVKVPSACRVSK